MIVRSEQPSDIGTIFEVTGAAFEDHPYSHQTEPFIIDALRAAGALTVSLVAEIEGKVVGHIAFSPVTISDGGDGWYALGPIAVGPRWQHRGVGSALVRAGLAALEALDAQGCVLVGEPKFYERFGFKSVPGLTMAGVPDENVMALPLGPTSAQGAITHHEAFSATAP